MTFQTIVVLGGGNALASYHAGGFEEMVRQGIRPDWIIGASAGAITGALIAGNRPEQRIARLTEFWAEAAMTTPFASSGNVKLRQYYNGWHVAWAALTGRPSIFGHRWPGFWGVLPGPQNDLALYDHHPLGETLKRLIDFDLLNRSDIRLSVTCVDIETGDEVVFDSRTEMIGPEHILASTAITPGFPPVEIGGRLLCDAGYVNNAPVDLAFATPPNTDTLVVLMELFSLRAPRPASIDAVVERTLDQVFASATRKAIAALRREYALREKLSPDLPRMRLLHIAYQAAPHELSMKSIDFSPSSLKERWAAGARDVAAGLGHLSSAMTGSGLQYVTLPDRPAE